MQLERPVRLIIVKEFDVPRTGVTEVRDNEVLSDGYSAEDLKAITVAKMEAYVGGHESFPRLWELTCAKAQGIPPPISIVEPKEVSAPQVIHNETEIHVEEKRGRGRPRKTQ